MKMAMNIPARRSARQVEIALTTHSNETSLIGKKRTQRETKIAADQAEPLSRGHEPTSNAQHGRYPTRKRKNPAYFSDYANWDNIPEEVTK